MSELLALGASHKTAPVAVRERIALTEAAAERFMRELVGEEPIQEAVVLSTCNRTELYLVVGDPVEAETAVLGQLARRAGVRPTELLEGIYSLRNCDAARHLYRVTSGLESMVVGEAEVQGQVKRAYEAALATQSTGPLTNKLFRAALATGKRVRTDTAISIGRASVASVAVDAAREALGDLGSRHVLIIGAGETAEGTARALHEQGVRTMFVANRRRERAIALAKRFGGDTVAFDALPDELTRADIVVASTSSPHQILGAEDLALVMPERAGRPLLLIDLAVPRDIDPACAELPGVTVSDIDDLQRQVTRQQLVRRTEARKAEGIVEEEIQTFAGWLGSLEVMPTLAALRTRGDEVVDRLLAENEGRWESLSPADRDRVELLARAAVNRLLHDAEIVQIVTSGDRAREVGDKSRWVDTIEAALVAGEIDLAVHSAKDVPAALAEGCAIVATPPRASAEDLLVRRAGAEGANEAPLASLPEDARIGTSSLRRRAQLLSVRPDLDVVELRGNVDTRLRKLDAGEVDAVVLAAAGLERLGVERAGEALGFVPAPGQGTLALEIRADDRAARASIDSLNHAPTFAALRAERAAVRILAASCHTPVGIHARNGTMRGFV